MTHVTFRAHDGRTTTVEAPEGWSLMQVATSNGIDGIVGECGGSCACATCHCYVDEQFAARLPAPEPAEVDMLANVAAERRPTSRLGCQVKVVAALEGAIIDLPECQE